jgi:hypothetical protein
MFFFWASFFLSSLSSFTLHRTLASDADHRRPLKPAAGFEGHAADEVEVVPSQGRSQQSTHGRLAKFSTPAAVSHEN